MNPFEPSSDARIAAKGLWDHYKALVDQGFTVEQAMEIIKVILGGVKG